MRWLEQSFYGNPLLHWLVVVGVAVTLAAGLWLARRALPGWLQARAARTATTLDDYAQALVGGTHFLFLLVLALYAGLQYVSLPPRAEWLVGHTALAAVLLQAALWSQRAIALWQTRTLRAKRQADAGWSPPWDSSASSRAWRCGRWWC